MGGSPGASLATCSRLRRLPSSSEWSFSKRCPRRPPSPLPCDDQISLPPAPRPLPFGSGSGVTNPLACIRGPGGIGLESRLSRQLTAPDMPTSPGQPAPRPGHLRMARARRGGARIPQRMGPAACRQQQGNTQLVQEQLSGSGEATLVPGSSSLTTRGLCFCKRGELSTPEHPGGGGGRRPDLSVLVTGATAARRSLAHMGGPPNSVIVVGGG